MNFPFDCIRFQWVLFRTKPLPRERWLCQQWRFLQLYLQTGIHRRWRRSLWRFGSVQLQNQSTPPSSQFTVGILQYTWYELVTSSVTTTETSILCHVLSHQMQKCNPLHPHWLQLTVGILQYVKRISHFFHHHDHIINHQDVNLLSCTCYFIILSDQM